MSVLIVNSANVAKANRLPKAHIAARQLNFNYTPRAIIPSNVVSDLTSPVRPFYWDFTDVENMYDLDQNVLMSGLIPEEGAGRVGFGYNFIPSANSSSSLATDLIELLKYNSNEHFSAAFWFNLKIQFDANDQIILFSYSTELFSDFTIQILAGTGLSKSIRILISGNDSVTETFNYDIPLNTWFHFVLTYDVVSGFLKLYINTILVATTSEPVFLVSTTKGIFLVLQVGGFGGATCNFVFDELAVFFNKLLSISDIEYLYNSGSGRTHPLTFP